MKKSKIFIPILIVIVIILFIGCGIAFSGSSSSSPTVSQTTVPETTITETTTVIETESSSVEAQSTKESTTAAPKHDDKYVLEFYKELQKYSSVEFKLNRSTTDFLENHADLFPVDNPLVISGDLIDYSIAHENISKSPDKYGDKLMYADSLTVVQIREYEYPRGRYTSINARDNNYKIYTIYYKGELPNIFDGSIINVYGLPLGYSSYENTGGGTTLTVVLAASNVSLYGTEFSMPTNNNANAITSSDSAEYILPDSSTKYFTIDDVNWLKTDEIRLAINEIYARHGRMFKSEELQNYFNSKSWYNPSIPADQFDDSVLNDCERHNIQVLQTVQ